MGEGDHESTDRGLFSRYGRHHGGGYGYPSHGCTPCPPHGGYVYPTPVGYPPMAYPPPPPPGGYHAVAYPYHAPSYHSGYGGGHHIGGAAAVYGAHHHSHGGHRLGHGGYGYGYGHHGKYKHGKHGLFHVKFKKWK